MKKFSFQSRTLAFFAVILPLLALFIYVALRSGPLAPIPVTVVTVEARSLVPGIFGIGTVKARYTCKIGPYDDIWRGIRALSGVTQTVNIKWISKSISIMMGFLQVHQDSMFAFS